MAVAPGEADALDLRVRDQRGAGLDARHGVEHTGWQDLVGDLDQPQHRQRRLLTRFDHDGVAGDQCGGTLLGEMDRGPIERQDARDDAVGFIDHPRLDWSLVDDLAGERVAEAGEEVEAVGAERHVIGQGIALGLAVLARNQFGQFVSAPADTVGDGSQVGAALPARQ